MSDPDDVHVVDPAIDQLMPSATEVDDEIDGDEITVATPVRGRDLTTVRKAIEDRLEARRLQADLDYLAYDLDE